LRPVLPFRAATSAEADRKAAPAMTTTTAPAGMSSAQLAARPPTVNTADSMVPPIIMAARFFAA
jgi:hypothetical protein